MDALLSVLLLIVGILIILNFTTISISDTRFDTGSCARSNGLFSFFPTGRDMNITTPSLVQNAQSITTEPSNMYQKYLFVS